MLWVIGRGFNMLINVLKFFIITLDQFDQIILDLGLNLTRFDSVYLLTYIVINVYAIAWIIGSVILVITILKSIFRKGGINDLLH